MLYFTNSQDPDYTEDKQSNNIFYRVKLMQAKVKHIKQNPRKEENGAVRQDQEFSKKRRLEED